MPDFKEMVDDVDNASFDLEPENTMFQEVRLQLWQGLPNIISAVCMFSIISIGSILIGKLQKPEYMAGFSLGVMTVNITGWSLLIGILSSQDTLSAEAFGAKNYQKVGNVTLAVLILCIPFCVVIAACWFFIAPVLHLLHQPPSAIPIAASYIRLSILLLPGVLLAETFRRFWVTQHVNTPPLIGGVCQVIVAVILCLTLVGRFQVNGVCCALIVSTYTFAGVLIALAKVGPYSRRVDPASFPSLRNWRDACGLLGQLIKLGLPGCGMTTLEWGSFEFAAFIAGSLGEYSLAGNSIIYSTVPMYFMCALGVSFVTSSRVASALGSKNGRSARVSAMAGLIIGITFGVTFGTITQTFKHQIVSMYTQNKVVQGMALPALFWASFMIACDSVQGMSQAVMRGAGKQHFGFPVMFISMYIICLPLAIVFSRTLGMGLKGVWLAMFLGYLAMDLMFIGVIMTMNWSNIAHTSSQRALSRPESELISMVKSDQNEE